MADFSCVPCNGQECFKLPVAERKACNEVPHMCPARLDNEQWRCRCCHKCMQACHDEAYAPY